MRHSTYEEISTMEINPQANTLTKDRKTENILTFIKLQANLLHTRATAFLISLLIMYGGT